MREIEVKREVEKREIERQINKERMKKSWNAITEFFLLFF